jgi:hypothetical protein
MICFQKDCFTISGTKFSRKMEFVIAKPNNTRRSRIRINGSWTIRMMNVPTSHTDNYKGDENCGGTFSAFARARFSFFGFSFHVSFIRTQSDSVDSSPSLLFRQETAVHCMKVDEDCSPSQKVVSNILMGRTETV